MLVLRCTGYRRMVKDEANKTRETKKRLLTVKIDAETLHDFGISANLRGTTMSALVIQSVLNTIREDKQRQPDKFPGYEPLNQAQEFEEVRTMLREMYGDKPIDPEELRKAFEILKTILEVKKA